MMEEHSFQSIADFINQSFEKKPQGKRNNWIEIFNIQEFYHLEDLHSKDENFWKTIDLPLFVKEGLKQAVDEQKNPTKHEQHMINSLFENGFTSDHIIQTLNIEQGSKKEQLINNYISQIYKSKPLPTNCKQLDETKYKNYLPLFLYNKPYDPNKKYYTLLVLGETGSGKTTLLDAFVNCLTGMEYSDSWRWKLTDENEFNHNDDNQLSQTNKISIYYVHDIKNLFNIRIIDTPGFGNTQGIEKDHQFVKQFENLFKEIKVLDYVLVTVQSAKTRLSNGTKFIYDHIQQIFGKDVFERFVLMCTFADGEVPLATSTLKDQIPFKKYFKFNNSVLYAQPQNGTTQMKFFWKMAMSSIGKFRKLVIKENLGPLSLDLSKQVLEQRECLQNSIKVSIEKINTIHPLLELVQNLENQVRKHQKTIYENQNYQHTYYEERYERIPLNGVYQMCSRCNKTCCQQCRWPNHVTETQCFHFASYNSGCNYCSCPRSAHIRCTEKIISKQVAVQSELTHKKLAFQQGQAELRNSSSQLQQQKIYLSQYINDIRVQLQY